MNPRGRVIGTEIEFGIVAVGQPLLSSVVSSTQVIKAYTDPGEAAGGADEARWDYGSESPLRDARGFDLGTAKPTADERARAPHHGVDVAEPAERWSAARWSSPPASTPPTSRSPTT